MNTAHTDTDTDQVHTTIDTATGQEAPPEVSQDRAQAIFTEIAEQYERFNHASSFGQDRRWLRRLVQCAGITGTSHVLDVAGGTGDVTFTICKMCHPASIVLSDYTPAMLDVARERLAAGDNRSVAVTTEVVDAQDMPFDDNSFDVVTMAYGIRNMPDRMAAMHEINRVLKPGGRVAILEFSRPPFAPARAFYNAYLRFGIPAWGQHFTGKRDDFVYLSQSIKAFPTQEEFAQMMREAGFQSVNYENLSFGAVAIHTGVAS